MRIRIGCRLTYDFVQPTPLIAILNVHYSRFGDLEQPDHLTSDPPVTIQSLSLIHISEPTRPY